MLRLLKIEWNKIFYYKTTRIFTIIYFLMLLAIGGILSLIKPEIGGMKLDIAKLGTFDFPFVWQNITFLVAIAKIFIAVIIITNVTNEFSNGTLKQNLIDGLSKKEFLTSKILTNLIFASLSTVFVLGICLFLGLTFSQSEEGIFKGMEFVGAYFLKLNLFFAIALFLAILLRKAAFAFLGLIVLWMGEGTISAVEFLFKAWMEKGLEKVDPYGVFISNYLPLNTSSKLIDLPKMSMEGFVFGGSVFKYSTVDWTFVVAAIIYTFIFLFLSYRLLKKRDL